MSGLLTGAKDGMPWPGLLPRGRFDTGLGAPYGTGGLIEYLHFSFAIWVSLSVA